MSVFGERKGDPGASDQGGRMMEFDPAGSTKEKVRRRAYELYQQRGAAHGLADSDWLAAEAQVLGIRRTW